MRYKQMKEENVYKILGDWCTGQGVSRIAETKNQDRKTVKCYIEKL